MTLWIVFLGLVFVLLALDLGLFHRDAHVISTREAFRWTGVWVSLSLLFSIVVYFAYEKGWVANSQAMGGREAVLEYLTGYLIEQSLSMDNIFVIAIIFSFFRVPQAYQHRVLFWGILGALVFRGIMIGIGVVLIQRFSWMIYVFGALLLYTAWRMYTSDDEEVHPSRNPVIRLFKKFFPVTKGYYGERFFIRRGKISAATPLLVALLVVETTDVMFAFDSIPAIFAITTDPFIVFTSNIFAILGLRSLYFVLASVLDRFSYLKLSLTFILAFVGAKMLVSHFVHIPVWVSLLVIAFALGAGIAASLIWSPRMEEEIS